MPLQMAGLWANLAAFRVWGSPMVKAFAGSVLVAALALVVSASSTTAKAQDLSNRPYVGIRAIGAIANLGDTDTLGFTGPVQVQNDSDQVAGPAIVGGWIFKNFPLRMEIEAGNRFRFDYDVRDLAPTGTVDYEIDVMTWQILLNTMFEWRNSSAFTPMIGASVGYARHQVDIQRTVLPTQVQITPDNSHDNIAWGGLLGVNWAFAQNWSADLMYRFINLGNVETGRMPTTGETIEAEDYVSHDVLLSVYYHF